MHEYSYGSPRFEDRGPAFRACVPADAHEPDGPAADAPRRGQRSDSGSSGFGAGRIGEGVKDPAGNSPPTHWIGTPGAAHYVSHPQPDGWAFKGTAECGAHVRGACAVFRGDAHPRCGACLARLIDGFGDVPD